VKRVILYVVFGLLFVLAGCAGDATTTEKVTTKNIVTTEEITQPISTVTEQETSEEIDRIQVILVDETYDFVIGDLSSSVFDMIEASDIELVYTTTEFGPYITQIGDLKQDSFHWLGFTKNGEFASSGIDTIEYTDGDVFEFTRNLSNWELTLDMELNAIEENGVVFEMNQYEVFIAND